MPQLASWPGVRNHFLKKLISDMEKSKEMHIGKFEQGSLSATFMSIAEFDNGVEGRIGDCWPHFAAVAK